MNFTTFNFPTCHHLSAPLMEWRAVAGRHLLARSGAPILAGLALALGGGVLVASAQTYVPLAKLPIGEGGASPDTWTLATYLTGAIKLLVASAGALAVVMLIIGGTQYVAAGINPSAKGDAKERIMNALIGLTLVLTSYLILYSIDPNLTKFSLTLPPVAVSTQSTTPLSTTYTPPVVAPPLTTPTSPSVTPPVTTPSTPSVTAPAPPSTATAVANAAAAAVLAQQNALNIQTNPLNDFSIMLHCMGNPTCAWYSLTDLNHDGKTDSADMTLFGKKGGMFDINQNRTVEIGDAPVAVSCFFKMSTANIYTMLPRENWNQNWSDSGPSVWYLSGYSCGGGGGITGSPTLACNGATWIKASVLGNQCAMNNGFMNMPFGFVYGGGSQFSQFQSWVVGSSVATAVNLTGLFKATFFRPVASDGGMPVDEYFETDVGKLTYATIAQYDLNNDGVADFGASGADMAVFNSCIGQPVSGVCAPADFNQDGIIDARDLGFVKFMIKDVFGVSTGIQFVKWTLNWFESMMFDSTGYNDQQIIKYCIGHVVTQKCAVADVNGTRAQLFASCSGGSMFSNCGINNVKVDNADLTDFNTGAAALDFNADGKVDLK